MHAPVSVAKSSTASGLKRSPKLSASASVSRPSASVLLISTVLPSSERMTSPSLYELPDGMFSVHAASACTSTASFSSAAAATAASTAAAPAMSVFMSSMPSLVFSDSPPESNVTPLPTSDDAPPRARRRPGEVDEARLLACSPARRRGTGPCPAAAQAARSRTSTVSPASRAHAGGGVRERASASRTRRARSRDRVRARRARAVERARANAALAVGGGDGRRRPQDERRRRGALRLRSSVRYLSKR